MDQWVILGHLVFQVPLETLDLQGTQDSPETQVCLATMETLVPLEHKEPQEPLEPLELLERLVLQALPDLKDSLGVSALQASLASQVLKLS